MAIRHRHTTIDGKGHTHEARVGDRKTFEGGDCVQPDDPMRCRPAAHGGWTTYDRCSCGAERWSVHRQVANGQFVHEYGPWTRPDPVPAIPQGVLDLID